MRDGVLMICKQNVAYGAFLFPSESKTKAFDVMIPGEFLLQNFISLDILLKRRVICCTCKIISTSTYPLILEDDNQNILL